MNIILNGNNETVSDGSTLMSVVNDKNINPKTIVAEVDGVIHKIEDFDRITLSEGSKVEILHFVGGG